MIQNVTNALAMGAGCEAVNIAVCAPPIAASISHQVKESSMKANENGSVLKSAQALIQAGRYEYRVVEIDETAFHVFGRKEDGLSLSLLETSLRKMWPRVA